MGNRLFTIATRTGDSGSTGLGNGSRDSNVDVRVAAMGDIDELNCVIVWFFAVGVPTGRHRKSPVYPPISSRTCLIWAARSTSPGLTQPKTKRVAALDDSLLRANAKLPRVVEFILPGGASAAAQAHIGRTACRGRSAL